jgi:hypothetical protein
MTSRHHDWFDVAQICLNGHLVNPQVVAAPDLNQDFCVRCGARTITACEQCRTPIPGASRIPGILSPSDASRPAYCPGCGSPFPWTEQRLLQAYALADDLEQLTPKERELLKQSIDELLADGPHAQLASVRFKKLVAKAGVQAAASFQEILVSIVSEAVRRLIWGA